MSDTGYIKMHRGWMQDPIFKDAAYSEREAWCWLIEKAMWRSTKHRIKDTVITLERGQYAVTVRELATVWQWNKNKVSRFLKLLEKDGKIGTKNGTESGTSKTVITICNYGKYQDERDKDGTEVGTQNGTEAGQRRDTKEEVKEIKEDIIIDSDLPERDICEEFVSIWNETMQGGSNPQVLKLTDPRIRSIKARYGDEFQNNTDFWKQTCERVRGSPHLSGENQRGWTADFDWVLKPANLTKILEGNYDKRTGSNKQTSRDSASVFCDLINETKVGRGHAGSGDAGWPDSGQRQIASH